MLLLVTFEVSAKLLRPTLIQKNLIVVEKNAGMDEGSELFIYSKTNGTIRFDGKAVVKSCDEISCRIKIQSIRKNIQLNLAHRFSTVKHTVKIIQIPVEPEASSFSHYTYASYGGPLEGSYNIGYAYQVSNSNRLGLKAGLMTKNEIGRAYVNGHFLSLQFDHRLGDPKSLTLHPYAEFGYVYGGIFTHDDLIYSDANVDSPFAGAGFMLMKDWSNFFIFGKLGFNYKFSKTSYDEGHLKTTYSYALRSWTTNLEAGLGFKF